MTATIEVARAGEGDPLVFDVILREATGETRHRVTLSGKDHARLAEGAAPEALVVAAFRFLLDREPKESILARFDLPVISNYFPEFDDRLRDYLRSAK